MRPFLGSALSVLVVACAEAAPARVPAPASFAPPDRVAGACAIADVHGEGVSAYFEGCLLETPDGELHVSTDVLGRLTAVYPPGFTWAALLVRVDGTGHRSPLSRSPYYALARHDGLVRIIPRIDNGPDYDEDGRIRYIGPDGRLGYIDSALEIVVPATFDWAFPFDEREANACRGCRSVPQGEHSWVCGGDWFVVDRTGGVRPGEPRLCP